MIDDVERSVTLRNIRVLGLRSAMPVRVAGSEYLTANEVCDLVGISRQTLWRWRQDEKVPLGQRLRGRQLLFSQTDVADIQRYATHLEPAEPARPGQLNLFSRQANSTA